LAGGKAGRLGSLIRAGSRVPRGFCITTRAYEQFIAEAGLIKHSAGVSLRSVRLTGKLTMVHYVAGGVVVRF
jgi:phosphoenolpyruvate synthase/pyruvate phosphate dikinase